MNALGHLHLEIQHLLFLLFVTSSTFAELYQTIPENNSLVCPGEVLQYTCISNTGALGWIIGSEDVTLDDSTALNSPIMSGQFELRLISRNGTVYISTATNRMITSDYDDTKLECVGGTPLVETIDIADGPANCLDVDVLCKATSNAADNSRTDILVSLSTNSSLMCVVAYQIHLQEIIMPVPTSSPSTTFTINKAELKGQPFVNGTIYTLDAENRTGQKPCLFSVTEPTTVANITFVPECVESSLSVRVSWMPSEIKGCLDDGTKLEYSIGFYSSSYSNGTTDDISYMLHNITEGNNLEVTITPTLPDLGLSGSPLSTTTSIVKTSCVASSFSTTSPTIPSTVTPTGGVILGVTIVVTVAIFILGVVILLIVLIAVCYRNKYKHGVKHNRSFSPLTHQRSTGDNEVDSLQVPSTPDRPRPDEIDTSRPLVPPLLADTPSHCEKDLAQEQGAQVKDRKDQQQTIDHLQKQLEQEEKHKECLQKQLEQEEKDKECLQKQLDHKEKDKECLQKQLEQEKKDKGHLQKQLEQAEEDKEGLEKQLAEKNKENEELKCSKGEPEQSLQNKLEEANSKIEELQKQVAEKDEKIKKLECLIESLTARFISFTTMYEEDRMKFNKFLEAMQNSKDEKMQEVCPSSGMHATSAETPYKPSDITTDSAFSEMPTNIENEMALGQEAADDIVHFESLPPLSLPESIQHNSENESRAELVVPRQDPVASGGFMVNSSQKTSSSPKHCKGHSSQKDVDQTFFVQDAQPESLRSVDSDYVPHERNKPPQSSEGELSLVVSGTVPTATTKL